MGWLLIAIFPTVTFAIAVDSREQCEALARMNQAHSKGAIMVCAKTFEV